MKKIFLLVFPDIRIQYFLEVYYFIITLSLGTAIFFTTRYLLERRNFYESAILKREMELQQLRSQLNPHFLFNALNNIYSYTLYNNKFGNELILKLSELMRFILDSAKFDSIPLSKEIGFIENYIAFENERLSNRCQINYSKNILFENREITPLILFPFIENAFKYGADTIQNTTVVIQLYDTKDELKLIVKNNIVKKTNPSTKTGLANAKRRLELLYPDKHKLRIQSSNDEYIVDLTLFYDKN
ncbi:MAG: histidine kinase [Chitinophagales bacterium]|nr:histidine kinase [Chitinophagales bacterium]